MKRPAYRASGGTLPYGNLLASHDVAMEGYFWRFTMPESGRVVIALAGINKSDGGNWSTLGLAAHPGGFLRTAEHPSGSADPRILGAYADNAFRGNADRLQVDFGDSHLDVRISNQRFWPHRRFGGSSYFQSVPALNQYWRGCSAAGSREAPSSTDRAGISPGHRCTARRTGEREDSRNPGGGDRHRGSPILEPAWRLPAARSAPDLCAPKSPPSLPRYRTERYCGWVIR